MRDPGGAVLLAAAGLAVGSFLNVCIYRLPRRRSVVRPGSRCTACGRALRWFENVPVLAYLVLRGCCRTCGAPISVVYPLVELATAALFLLQYGQLGWQPLLVVRLAFTGALVILFVVDLRHRILPNEITLPGVALGVAAGACVEPGWRAALLGAAAGGGALLAVAAIYRRVRGEEGLGMGDVKMLAMVGAFLGLPLAYVTLAWASLLGAIVGIGMMRWTGAGWQHPLPLGSFLAAAAVVASLVGDPFLDWYVAGAERFLEPLFGDW